MACPYTVTCLEKYFFVEAGQRPYLPAVASLSILLFSVKKVQLIYPNNISEVNSYG